MFIKNYKNFIFLISLLLISFSYTIEVFAESSEYHYNAIWNETIKSDLLITLDKRSQRYKEILSIINNNPSKKYKVLVTFQEREIPGSELNAIRVKKIYSYESDGDSYLIYDSYHKLLISNTMLKNILPRRVLNFDLFIDIISLDSEGYERSIAGVVFQDIFSTGQNKEAKLAPDYATVNVEYSAEALTKKMSGINPMKLVEDK